MTVTPQELEGLCDPITSVPLRPDDVLHRCTRCKVFLCESSLREINSRFGGSCPGCSQKRGFSPVKVASQTQTPLVFRDLTNRAGEAAITGTMVSIEQDAASRALLLSLRDHSGIVHRVVVSKNSQRSFGGIAAVRALEGRRLSLACRKGSHLLWGDVFMLRKPEEIKEVTS